MSNYLSDTNWEAVKAALKRQDSAISDLNTKIIELNRLLAQSSQDMQQLRQQNSMLMAKNMGTGATR